jgi:phytanoyl-CoA hydroxylase
MSELIENFERDGFAIGERVLSDEQCDLLCSEIEQLIENKDNIPDNKKPVLLHQMRNEKPIWQIVNIYLASENFRNLMHNSHITSTIAELSGAKELRLWHDQIQYKPSYTGGQNYWHQDWPLWGILDRPSQITAWVALDDADLENGCMSMVKGSHKWGNNLDVLREWNQDEVPFFDIPSEFEKGKIEHKLCPVKKGHVHYHHGLTWHGSHANESGRPRRAIALHYMTDKTCYNAEGGHVMKQFAEVNDGEKLAGSGFPLVYADDKPVLI